MHLNPENAVIYDVYERCSDDWIMSGGMESSRMAISGPAIETAIRITGGIHGKDQRKFIFDRVKMVGRAVANEIAKEMARQREEKKAGG